MIFGLFHKPLCFTPFYQIEMLQLFKRQNIKIKQMFVIMFKRSWNRILNLAGNLFCGIFISMSDFERNEGVH